METEAGHEIQTVVLFCHRLLWHRSIYIRNMFYRYTCLKRLLADFPAGWRFSIGRKCDDIGTCCLVVVVRVRWFPQIMTSYNGSNRFCNLTTRPFGNLLRKICATPVELTPITNRSKFLVWKAENSELVNYASCFARHETNLGTAGAGDLGNLGKHWTLGWPQKKEAK